MKLVEQHIIKRTDPRFQRIDEAAFASKNLWNAANYLVRQSFIFEGTYLNYVAVFHQIKSHEAYQALPRKVSNQVLLQLHHAWVSFFEAMHVWREHPEQFTGRPSSPWLVNGRPVKSINQCYNKQRARHQKTLARTNRYTSRQLDRITTKRNRRIVHYLHTASRRIIDLLVAEGIGTLIIGKNPLWKQEVEMGKRNNQAFVHIPHARLIEMLTEESYTSQASILDRDPLPVYDPARSEAPRFSGRRDGRWYRASDKRIIHADVNGSYNIARKVVPTAFEGLGIGAPAVVPRRLSV